MTNPDAIPLVATPIDSLSLEGGEGVWLYRRLIVTLVVGMLIYIVLVFAVGGPLTQQVGPMLFLLGSAVSWQAYRRGHIHLAIRIILWILLVGLLIQAALRGGLANPALHGLVVLMVIAGWLLGPLYGLWLALASIASTFLMMLAIESQVLHPDPIADGVSYWLAQAIVQVLAAILMWSVIKAHWRHLRQVKQLNAKLTENLRVLSAHERELAASENRFVRMHESSPVPITLSRIDNGTYIDVNPAWVALFGWSREEVRGKTSLDIGFFADPEMRNQGLKSFKRDGRAQLEVTANTRDSGQRELVCSVERIDYDGMPAALTLMFDLTERKRIENELRLMNDALEHRVAERTSELEHVVLDLNKTLDDLHQTQDELVQSEKQASLGRLVAGMAHELNTPIGNAITASSTLGGELAEFESAVKGGVLKRSHVDKLIEIGRFGTDLIERSLGRAAALVHSFKQVAADQTSEQRRQFDLAAVVDDIVDAVRRSMTREVCRIEVSVPEVIMLDSYPGPLGQVLTNVIMNAVLHAFEGRSGGTVTVSARSNGGMVELCCRDNGVGMPPDVVSRVFDPFFTTKLGYGGSGLGLAIVQQLVTQLLGGKIWAESRIGAGSCFTLLIPLVAPVRSTSKGGVEVR